MRSIHVGVASVLLLVGVSGAQAQTAGVEHPWLIRARGVVVAPNASSDKLNLKVATNATMEVDINRYLNKNLSLELILATTGHEVKSGSTTLGSANVLPPTLLLQFRPMATGVSPYVGAGGNLGYFYGKSGGLDQLDLTTSFGWAAQVGIDVPLGGRGVFNIDGKYVALATDVKSNGTKLAHLKINPVVIGAGLGYRF
jgi:outer membrane protein